MDNIRIGFIGMGVMGAPMAGNLAAAGYPVLVFDNDPGRAEAVALADSGIDVAPDKRALAAGADIVITMLPDGEAVRQVVTGPDGIGHAMRSGSLLLDTSSSEPWLTRQTAQWLSGRGVAMVDAPVSGAQWGAQAAELVFMVGGSSQDLVRVRPLLEEMGRAVHHVGPLGAGHTMKCINNMITAMTFIATAEGLAVGKRGGLDPVAMNDVLNESTGGSWLTRNHFAQRIFSRSFDDPFKLDLMVKDVGIAMGLAQEQGVPLPLSAVGQQLYRAAALSIGPGRSVSEMVRWIEQLTGTELTTGQGPADASRPTAGAIPRRQRKVPPAQ
ncbi:MAG: NAD(P)-dependent oxidoreductase [Lautropia sp.]